MLSSHEPQPYGEFLYGRKWHNKECPCASGQSCTCDEQEDEQEQEEIAARRRKHFAQRYMRSAAGVQ